MRWQRHLLVLGLCLLGPGCGPIIRYSTRNFVEAQCDFWGRAAVKVRDGRVAEVAWEEVQSTSAEPYSEHYAWGFKEGFVDHLKYGGCGQPPVAPPWCLRKPKYETPEGLRAADDWFAGFRHGAQTAQASGLRELVVVPLSGPGQQVALIGPRVSRPTNEPSPVLPPPRRVPGHEDYLPYLPRELRLVPTPQLVQRP